MLRNFLRKFLFLMVSLLGVTKDHFDIVEFTDKK